jgi:gliding motility-associated lipoprotein GldH
MARSLFDMFVLLGALLLAGCRPGPVLKEKKTFADQGWSHADTLDFKATIADTSLQYDLFIDVAHSPEFPNQNFYLRILTQFPDGIRQEKLVSLELADNSGFWFGRCNKKNCRLRIPIQEKAFFNQPGAYLFTLEQYSRLDPLPGIKQMGMLIRPSR